MALLLDGIFQDRVTLGAPSESERRESAELYAGHHVSGTTRSQAVHAPWAPVVAYHRLRDEFGETCPVPQ
jgi:predicted NodU family carbamoyl transferase